MTPAEPLAILFEDAHLIAVAKPAGLLTQGYAGGEPTLEGLVRAHLAPGDPGSIFLGTVHRLDRPVSGVVVWARTPRSARRLAAQFAGRSVAKEYWGLVESPAPGPWPATWDDWLGPVDASGVARIVAEEAPGAKRAVTRARPLEGRAAPGLVLLALEPETGRTHQLRAQASGRGRPIVGDAAYGSTRAFPAGIALHARALRLEHPSSRRELRLEAGPPATWSGWLAGPRPPTSWPSGGGGSPPRAGGTGAR